VRVPSLTECWRNKTVRNTPAQLPQLFINPATRLHPSCLPLEKRLARRLALLVRFLVSDRERYFVTTRHSDGLSPYSTSRQIGS
jgi:hypothetical protein